MNESRPGVTSRVLLPGEAARKAEEYLKHSPETAVIGFAGPGEPLANKETFETLETIRGKYPDILLCLSTNGLYLPENIHRLKDLGVQYLTVTVNAATAETGAKICRHVRDHGSYLTGKEGAALLLDRQEEGIRRAVEAGLTVKINVVLLEGINTGEICLLAEKAAGWGVKLMNMNPVINVTKDPEIRPVSGKFLLRCRTAAEKYLPQMDFCRQCRADAAGIPGLEKRGSMCKGGRE